MQGAPYDTILKQLDFIRTRRQEHLICFALDSLGNILHRHIVYIGTFTQSFASPRDIFAKALKCNAYSIIIAHNHPSGEVTPSEGDIDTTQQLMAAGLLLDVHLLDHIIVAKTGDFSFAANSLLLHTPPLFRSPALEDELEA